MSALLQPANRTAAPVERSVWRALIQFLPHAVLLLDDELHIILANKAASRLFRVPLPQLTGVPFAAIVPPHDPLKWIAAFSAQRKVIETTVEIPGSDDPRVTLKIVAMRLARSTARSRMLNSTSAPGEYRLLVLEDISDRAALEQQLIESEKQAAMGQLAAGILHEVANPLNALGSNLVFVRSALDERSRALQQALDVSLEQLNQMRQLLGTLSGVPGRTSPRFEPANLVDSVRRSVAFVHKDTQRRRIHVEVCEAPVRIVCEMDVRLIRQVLLNVLKNAIEAMPDGGRIDIRIRQRPRDGGNGMESAVVEIADTGVGIADTDLRKVFRPLFSTKPRGAGLGLSFCRQTIEEHGGCIRVMSPGLDRGTIVTIILPLQQSGSSDQG